MAVNTVLAQLRCLRYDGDCQEQVANGTMTVYVLAYDECVFIQWVTLHLGLVFR